MDTVDLEEVLRPTLPVEHTSEDDETPGQASAATSVLTSENQPRAAKVSSSQPFRRPSCTHIIMGKMYGTDLKCNLCDRVPPLGWLYVCQQDLEYPQLFERTEQQMEKLPATCKTLEQVGCNASVIEAARKGHYTKEEMEIIIHQKLRLRAVIAAETHPPKARPLPKLPGDHAQKSKLTKVPPASKKDAKPTKSNKTTRVQAPLAPVSLPEISQPPPCEFRCCFNCRPFCRDRSLASFESVISDTSPILRENWNPYYQPVAKAHIVKDIGQQKLPSKHASGCRKNEQSTIFETDEFISPLAPTGMSYVDMLRAAYSRYIPTKPGSQEAQQQPKSLECNAFRSSWKKALSDMVRNRQEAVEDSEAISHGLKSRLSILDELEEHHTRGKDDYTEHYETTDSELDLFKRLSEELQREASHIALPDAESMSSFSGEEKHVHGGVALTEEAIEHEAPDIITAC